MRAQPRAPRSWMLRLWWCTWLLQMVVASAAAFAQGGASGRCKIDNRCTRQLQRRMAEDNDTESSLTPSSSPDSTSATTTNNIVCPNCDLCDGSGRIAGGLGAILPMLPIKAYKPCPNFVARGGQYRRSGQGLDEIAFGRDSSYNSRK